VSADRNKEEKISRTVLSALVPAQPPNRQNKKERAGKAGKQAHPD